MLAFARRLDTLLYTCGTTRSRVYRTALILALTVLYVWVFWTLHPRYGDVVVGLLVFPLIAAAGLFGVRAGLLVWLLGLPFQTLLYGLCCAALWTVIVDRGILLGFIALLPVIVVVGRQRDLWRQMSRELDRRRSAEAELLEKQQFVERLVLTIPDIVYVYHLTDRRITFINRSVAELPVRLTEPLSIDQAREYVFPEDREKLLHLDERLRRARDGEVVEVEYHLPSRNGTRVLFQNRSMVFTRSPDGTPALIISTARDVTDKRRTLEAVQITQQLQLSLAKQNELNQIKNRFMTTISHEFRTPFAIILSSAELLERYFDRLTAERRLETLLSIKLQIQHLRDMLDDISVILRQEESPPLLSPVPTNIVELVSRLIDKASVSVAEAHHLRFETQGDLTAVMLDPNLVTTIVRNLLSNAIKFSPAGSEIRLNLSRAGQEVVFRLSDDGIGIPHDEQHLIFETFYRARNASHIPGMGLGLSVVREYVDIHLGRVEVDSAEGKGATFTVWLPCELTAGA